MTQQEIILLRGEIVDKLTHLDGTMCVLMSMHYFHEKRDDFIFDVLYEKNVSVFSKKTMIRNIFRRKSLDTTYLKDIDRLLEIRNIFAHAWAIICGSVPDGTENEDIDCLELRKNDQEEYDAKALKEEFDKTFMKVQHYLFDIIGGDKDKKGIQTLPKQGGLSHKD